MWRSFLATSWSNGLVRLIRKYDPDFSTTDFDPQSSLDQILSSVGDRSNFNFYYIKFGDSDSLSFFRLFEDLSGLNSFRSLLESLPYDQCRLVILFTTSMLRFRFRSAPMASCPLCRKQWLWDHFFTCPRLSLVPSLPTTSSLLQFKSCVRNCNWPLFRQQLRFVLTEWQNVLPDAAISADIIENLWLACPFVYSACACLIVQSLCVWLLLM